MTSSPLPPLPLNEWEDTKTTLHLFAQVVGKIRLALNPKVNHWWHVPLYVSARGLTTQAIPHQGWSFQMTFDFCDHDLVIETSGGESRRVPLADRSVSRFYREVREQLAALGIHARIVAKPFDPSKTKSEIPFAADDVHATYDPEYAQRFWRILVGVDAIFHEFRGRFLGKCSPVHFFWHSFDLAVTRFSGRATEVPADADPVTKEAYSHEVISAGFWPGDDTLPEPAFYSYVAPEPEGLAAMPIAPEGAWWQPVNGSSMALYTYDAFRKAEDPRAALMSFLESVYVAGATRAAWSADLTRPSTT